MQELRLTCEGRTQSEWKRRTKTLLGNKEHKSFYQLPLIALYYCIVTRWSDKHFLSHGMCLCQVMMMLHFLKDAESTQSSIIISQSLV